MKYLCLIETFSKEIGKICVDIVITCYLLIKKTIVASSIANKANSAATKLNVLIKIDLTILTRKNYGNESMQ